MLSRNDVIEGNKLIAEFTLKGCKLFKEFESKEGFDREFTDWFGENIADYSSSWNYLMPVVEKIESLGFWVNIKKNHVTIARDNKGTFDSNMIHSEFGDQSKIERLFICVVSFIKYYNKNKN